jgi:hypothetical protein
VEQVNESERSVIKPMLQALEDMGSNDVPIHLDDLQASMPMDPHAQGDQVFLGHHKKCHARDMDSRKSSQRATTTESFERIPQDSEPRFSRGSLILAGSEIEENMEGSISENRGSRGYYSGEGDNLRITPPRGHEIPSNDDDRNDELVTIQDFFQYPERIFSPPDVNKSTIKGLTFKLKLCFHATINSFNSSAAICLAWRKPCFATNRRD